MTLELRKFDPRQMKDGCVVMAVARRASGKSELIKDLMYFKRHVPCGIVCSGTEDGNSFYQSIVPELYVYNHFNKQAIERLLEQQRRAKVSGKHVHPVYLVLDDLMYDKKFLNDKLVRYLFMNGRHFNICMFITAQYLVDVPPGLRANIDYVFVLRDNVHRERLWRNIFTIFPSLDMFQKAMDACTQDYGALVLDNNSASTRISDCVFWYKSKLGRKFRMGTDDTWAFAKKNTRRASGSEGPDEQVCDKKSSVGFVVKKKG
jgi:hypothetical protein